MRVANNKTQNIQEAEREKGICQRIFLSIKEILVEAIYWIRCLFSYGCFLTIFGGFLFLLIFLLSPLNFERSYVHSIADLKLYQIDIPRASTIQIVDSKSCNGYDYGFCVEETCTYSLATYIDFNCKYEIKISKPIFFEKFVINCKTNEQCEVEINSDFFRSDQLFMYGYNINVNANKIQTRNLFFDSYLGSLKIQKLIFEKAAANTSLGDIVIQTTESVQLTSKTNKKYVCLTCAQGWLDTITSITNLANVFIEKDEKKDECLQVYPFHIRNQQNMITSGLHSVLEQQNQSEQVDQLEQRCQFIEKVILMNNQNNPSTVTNIKQIIAGNQEGNIHVNIVQDNDLLSPKLINSEYKYSELSPSSQSLLKDLITSINDSGKNNEIVYLDFRQSNDFIENFLYVMLFNPIYLHLSPAWLSALSFHSLSNKEQQIQLSLKPGFCPYVFSYSQLGSEEKQEQIVQIREIEIQKVIDEYLVKENLNVYFTSPWKDYTSFSLRDERTYLDIDGITTKIKIVVSTEIICIFILIYIVGITYVKLINKLTIFYEKRKEIHYQKMLFFFYQNRFSKLNFQLDDSGERSPSSQQSPLLQCSNSQPDEVNNNEKDQIIQSTNSTNKKNQEQESNQKYDEEEENEDISKKYQLNKIKLSCSFVVENQDTFKLFQSLSTQAFSWLLQRYNSSRMLFFIRLFKFKSRDKLKQGKVVTTQISVSDVKEYYQKFCYMFNLQEEPLFNQKHSWIKFKNDQTIVFKKFEKNDLQEGQTLVYLSRSQKQYIQQYIDTFGPLTGQMCYSQFDYYMESRIKINPQQIQNKEGQQDQNDDKQNNNKQSKADNNHKEQSQSNNNDNNEEDKNSQSEQNEQEGKEKMRRFSYFEIHQSHEIDSEEEEDEDDEQIRQNKLQQNDENDGEQEKEQFTFYIYATNKKILDSEFLILNINFLKFIDVNFDSFLLQNKNNRQILKQIYNENDIKPSQDFLNELKQKKSLKINDDGEEVYKMYKKYYLNTFYYIVKRTLRSENEENYVLNSLLQKISFILIQILYLLSPFVACFISLAFAFIYLNQYHKFSVDSNYQFGDADIVKKVVNFSDIGVSLLFYSCLLFIAFFYFLTPTNYITNFSKRARNIYSANLNIIYKYQQSYSRWAIFRSSSNCFKKYFKCFFTILYERISKILFLLQLMYLSVALLILIVGTIVFPSVQLPTLIFFGFLVGVIINSVINFREAYQTGYENLRQSFENRFIESCKKLYENKDDSLNQINYISIKQGTLLKLEEDQQPNKGKPKQEYPRQATKIIGVKDLGILSKNKYDDIFNSIEGCQDKELSEKEFKNFLRNINMSINQVQLDQLYSHLYSQDISYHCREIKLWKMHKKMDQRQFEIAIDYIINQKVQFTLNILDISYASLCLSTIKTVLISIVIAWIIYSVFACFSASSSSFDFNSNSLVSLGGILGIIFSKEDKGKIFEDKDLIEQTVDITEMEMHSYF